MRYTKILVIFGGGGRELDVGWIVYIDILEILWCVYSGEDDCLDMGRGLL